MLALMGLIFLTVAHQCNGTSSSKSLKQAQGELLPMVLDEAVAAIDAATFLQLRSIAPCILSPSDLSLVPVGEQYSAHPNVGHPYVITVLRHADTGRIAKAENLMASSVFNI